MLDASAAATVEQSFCSRLYDQLLFRPTDPGGLAYWQSQLSAGLTPNQLAADVQASPEYQAELVTGAYGALLRRAPTSAELTAGVSALAAGETYESLEAQILGSPEYFNSRGGGDNSTWLAAVYQDVLDRPIDGLGTSYWLSALALLPAGSARQTIAAQIIASQESERDFIALSYQRLLHRPADAAGLDAWTAAMQQGLTDEQVIADFLGSNEFYLHPVPVSGDTTISGVLVNANGQPQADVPLSFGNANTESGANGAFTLTLNSSSALTENLGIPVPKGDPFFDPNSTGTQAIPMRRDQYDPNSGTGVDDPRQFPEQITSFLDASVVYGSDPQRAAALRTFVGGQLKTSPGDLLPLNNPSYFPGGLQANDNNGPLPPTSLFVAGDVRANENTGLTALQTLFVREHNYWCQQYQALHPDWTDEQLYQAARKMVSAEIDHLTYSEYLPLLLGPNAIGPYQGYNPAVDPTINTLFSTAAFRFAHSQIFDNMTLPEPGGGSLPPLSLAETSFNPGPLLQYGLSPILLGMSTQQIPGVSAAALDVDRNELFGPPGSGGIDLVSVDLERGRDMGLPSYDQARELFGLPTVTSFSEITSDPSLQSSLQATYGSVDKIDVLVGGLAEDHAPGAMVGPLFQRIIADQFERLRDGDRFWYENGQFTASELAQIDSTTLADVIARNTDVTSLPNDVFTTSTNPPAGPAAGPGTVAAATDPTEVRSIDGTGNNLAHPAWGAAGTDLTVVGGVSYFGDGISSPGGADRPNPRVISNNIFARSPTPDAQAQPTSMDLFWGQFITHDMDLTHDEYPAALKIYSGAAAQQVTPENLSLILGHELYQGMDNVIAEPIAVKS